MVIQTNNLAVTKFHEILRCDVLTDIETGRIAHYQITSSCFTLLICELIREENSSKDREKFNYINLPIKITKSENNNGVSEHT